MPMVNIGVVVDGSPGDDGQGLTVSQARKLLQMVTREIRELTGQEFIVRFPEGKTIFCNWDPQKIRFAVNRLLEDNSVDLIIAFGPFAAAEVCTRSEFLKPVIAPFVIDIEAQGVPLSGGTSGVHNLNYVTLPHSLELQMERFHQIVGFETVHIIYSDLIDKIIPDLRDRTLAIVERIGARGVAVPVGRSAADALEILPADTEAVFLAPLPRFSINEFQRLLDGLREAGIPTFAFSGQDDVNKGVLLGVAPASDYARLVKRIGLNVQRTLLGEDPAALPVILEQEEKLSINMNTARSIGWYPTWDMLNRAELVGYEEEEAERTWSLDQAVQEGLGMNPRLRAQERLVSAGEQEVVQARANLKPHLDLSAAGTTIDSDRAAASLGQQAERTISGSFSLSQALYSEPAMANLDIQKHLQTARAAEYEQVRLDTVLDISTAFLDVLRARTLERIRREDLRLTENNLRIARKRQELGVTGPAEVYRWESELATSRRELIQATQQHNTAKALFNSRLHHPQDEKFNLEEPETLIRIDRREDLQLKQYIDNPWSFELFLEFVVGEGLGSAPELRGLTEAIKAAERSLRAAKRSFWAPEVTLFGAVARTMRETGEGSDPVVLFPGAPVMDDTDWNVGLNLSLPLLAGGFRKAEVRKATEELARLRYRRDSVRDELELRIRAALYVLTSSAAAIELSEEAAAAARRNLELVGDSYSRGVVSIIDLLDAQNASLVADQIAANAVYDYLIDLMEAQRAASNFQFFNSENERKEWFDRLNVFFSERGWETTGDGGRN